MNNKYTLEEEYMITYRIREDLARREKTEEEGIEYVRLLNREKELKELIDD